MKAFLTGNSQPWEMGKFYIVVLCSILSFSILSAEPIDAAKTTRTILNAVVKVRSEVPAKACTARSLGTEQEGSGVVIGSNGLILTTGDLVLKANRVEVTGSNSKGLSARFLGYDHNTGFGLIRAEKPLNVEPIKFGNSSEVNELMVCSSDRYKHFKPRPNKRNFYGQGFTMKNRMLSCNLLVK